MQLLLWLVTGIALGPSFFNLGFPPWASAASQFAGGAFLFVAGFEMKFPSLRNRLNYYAVAFTGAFLFPFLIGFIAFSGNIFLSLAMGISALPVAIQILKEKGRYNSPLAQTTIALSCLCDISAWIIMAFIFPRENLASWITSHWIIFSFFVGLLAGQLIDMPAIFQRLQKWILAPVFFVCLGWKIPILSLFALDVFVVIFGVAVLSKTVGVFSAMRLNRESNVAAREISALLNARGAMEILAANFAFSARLINGAEFSGLVVVGVLTSIMAWPFVRNNIQAGVNSNG